MATVTEIPFEHAELEPPARGWRQAPLAGSAPRRWQVDAALVTVAAGLGITVGLAATAESAAQLRAGGGVAMFLGSLTGLAGTYLALVMILLVSRLPFVERVLGQDGLLRWHRTLAPWPISLIVAHVLLLTIAYAQATKVGLLHQVGAFLSGYAGMTTAFAGFGLMVAVAIVSIHWVRRRLRRETWWAIHLAMYLAFALAFTHEVVLGPSFVGHPLTQAVWGAVWAATAGLVLAFRVGMPAVRSLRHGLRVHSTKTECEGVTSIVLTGRHLEQLAISGGQFLEWRFLVRGLWWQAHPYTLSARPQPPFMRLTVKAVGDHSSAISSLPPGTRVAVEGPYGVFTAHAQRHDKVAIIAGGIGVTAARALLEDLDRRSAPVVMLRASSKQVLALEEEIRQLVAARKGKLLIAVGSRDEVPIERMLSTMPDLRRRDVYVSGPEGFVRDVVAALQRRGVRHEAIHAEVYAL